MFVQRHSVVSQRATLRRDQPFCGQVFVSYLGAFDHAGGSPIIFMCKPWDKTEGKPWIMQQHCWSRDSAILDVTALSTWCASAGWSSNSAILDVTALSTWCASTGWSSDSAVLDVLTLLTWGDSAVNQSTALLIIRQPIIDVTALSTRCNSAVDHLPVPLLMCWCCQHDATVPAIMRQCHYCWCDCTVDVMQQHCQHNHAVTSLTALSPDQQHSHMLNSYFVI
jgi:hypothetical protein